jgi:hypothetical protein
MEYFKGDEFFKLPAQWSVVPRGDVAPHWTRIFVTMNTKGEIVLARRTHEILGSPEAYVVRIDTLNDLLGLEPATFATKDAYPARVKGGGGARVIRVHRLITQYNLRPPDTIEFMKTKIDLHGHLIMCLKEIRISPKAHSQCRLKDRSSNSKREVPPADDASPKGT